MKRKYKKFQRQVHKKVLTGFKILFILLASFLFILFLISQPVDSNSEKTEITELLDGEKEKEAFFLELSPYAQEVSKSHGVRTSLLLAQAALESNWGQSQLARESNNYFGIKSKDGREYPTQEFRASEWESVDSSFKEYESVYDSVLDYADLLKNGTSWDAELYQGVIQAESYEGAAYALTDAGYATDPRYAEKIIKMIEQYDLNELDE